MHERTLAAFVRVTNFTLIAVYRGAMTKLIYLPVFLLCVIFGYVGLTTQEVLAGDTSTYMSRISSYTKPSLDPRLVLQRYITNTDTSREVYPYYGSVKEMKISDSAETLEFKFDRAGNITEKREVSNDYELKRSVIKKRTVYSYGDSGILRESDEYGLHDKLEARYLFKLIEPSKVVQIKFNEDGTLSGSPTAIYRYEQDRKSLVVDYDWGTKTEVILNALGLPSIVRSENSKGEVTIWKHRRGSSGFLDTVLLTAQGYDQFPQFRYLRTNVDNRGNPKQVTIEEGYKKFGKHYFREYGKETRSYVYWQQ